MSNSVSALFEKRTRAFPLGPDKTALFLGRDYRHALEGIRDGMAQGCRLICLLGAAGTGKSMLLRTLRTQLPPGIISEISQPPLGGLLSRLAAGLGMEIGDDDEAAVQQRFREYFATQDSAVIQVIDDAESLTRDDLALLLRLFEPIQGQILLVGQPPLLSLFEAEHGKRSGIKPDRIYYLEPLSPTELGAYISHRLNEAGFDRDLFVPEAIAAVGAYSGGLPRLVNLLCFTALARSEFDVSTPIAAESVHEAARQRMAIGNYPFIRPPLAPGWRPIPVPAAATAAGEAQDDHQDADEHHAISGKPRRRRDGAAHFGYGRMLLTLMAGVVLGMVISRMSLTEHAGTGSADSASVLAHPLDSSLREMKSGLVDVAEWVIDWAGADASSAAAPGTAPDLHGGSAAPQPDHTLHATSLHDKGAMAPKLPAATPLPSVQREHIAAR